MASVPSCNTVSSGKSPSCLHNEHVCTWPFLPLGLFFLVFAMAVRIRLRPLRTIFFPKCLALALPIPFDFATVLVMAAGGVGSKWAPRIQKTPERRGSTNTACRTGRTGAAHPEQLR